MRAGERVKLMRHRETRRVVEIPQRCSGHQGEAFVRTHKPHTLDMCVLLLINFVSSLHFNVHLRKQVL